MGVGMCLYAQLLQTKNKQWKSAIQLNSTQLTTPKEKSGLQEERSYKSLYKSPILQ